MTDTILSPLILSIALGIGVFLGFILTKLKMKASLEIANEQNNQLKLQIEAIKTQHSNIVEDLKQSNHEGKDLLEKQLISFRH